MSQLEGIPQSSRLGARHRFDNPVPEKCPSLDQKPGEYFINGFECTLLRKIPGSVMEENHWKNTDNQRLLQFDDSDTSRFIRLRSMQGDVTHTKDRKK
jgi:hypothetical protein